MRPHATIALLTAALLATTAFAVAQQEPDGPQAREDKDKIVLQNEDITVWFHGKKPFLKIFETTAAENASAEAAFTYKFHEVVEYRDLDENGLPAETEVLASLLLEKASGWEVETAEANGTVVLTLTLEAPVKLAGRLMQDESVTIPTDRAARVALVFTISGEALSVDTGDANITVPTNAIKYDFVVEQWPFVDGAESRLALESQVTGGLQLEDVLGVNGASVAGNGTQLGVVAWTDTAQGVTTDGENVTIDVRTELEAMDGAEAGANATGMTRLVHTYDAADLASFVHDPVIGVASAGSGDGEGGVTEGVGDNLNGVPAPGVALVAAAIAAAAVVMARRRS